MAVLECRSSPLAAARLAFLYLSAKETVINAGFDDEIDWQEQVNIDKLNESTFLSESAWVIISTGFREEIARRKFGAITKAFLNWYSAKLILDHRASCRRDALATFANVPKIDGILGIAEEVVALGFEEVHLQVLCRGTDFLQELPFIGPVTACHLGKNLGLPTAKADRHLVRMASKAGYATPQDMCATISGVVGDPIAVVDIVLWRYATLAKMKPGIAVF